MHQYFSYHIDPNIPTLSFYGTEIKKDEISSVGIKSSVRYTIVEWSVGLFLLFCLYGIFTRGFSFNGFISVVIAIGVLCTVTDFWGRRVVVTLKNGKDYRSTLLRLPDAKKAIEDISKIL